MKGVLFNVVEDVVVDQFSEEVWDDVLQRAELAGAYTALGNYPDDDLDTLSSKAAEGGSRGIMSCPLQSVDD